MITIKNIIVKETNKVFRAISFGVFCLEAPSTRDIILSKNDSPGSELIRTLIQSDTTSVPPVTEEKSPPLSLVTGADSPVIADSSILAIPSIISPSLGIISPTFTKTTSPFFRSLLEISISFPSSKIFLALVSFFVFFNVSACAFPLPSATDSAKFANNKVINKIMETSILYLLALSLPSFIKFGKKASNRQIINPISTTNITGFFIIYLGFNFKNAPLIEVFIISLLTNFVFLLTIFPPIVPTILLLVLKLVLAKMLVLQIYKQLLLK